MNAIPAITNIISTAAIIPFSPQVTGPLLLVLLRGPKDVRNRLITLLTTTPGLRNVSISRWTTILGALLTFGVVKYANAFLNSYALNHWTVRKEGTPWDFPNEIALVTGGSSGMGKIEAEMLAKRLKKVIVLDVQDPPKELESNPKIAFYKCDITDKAALHSIATTIRRDHGKPTILLNNAGIVRYHTILDTTEDYVNKVFHVNNISQWFTVQEFLPDMLAARKGHILTICSGASYLSFPKLAAYSATKAAALAFHEGLNIELKEYYPNGRCIQTTSVHPSWVNTPMADSSRAALLKGGQTITEPEVVADAVVKQILSGRGAQLFIPSNTAIAAQLRGWPNWMQEFVRAGAAAMVRDTEG